MSSEHAAKRTLLVACIWLVLAALLGTAYKFLIQPYFASSLQDATGSASQYRHHVALAADGFSGYAMLRAPALQRELQAEGIRWEVRDDGADYAERIRGLQAQKVQLAVFTIDSYLSAGAKLGAFPGSIVLVIDESRGADAVLAAAQGPQSIQDLNHPGARLVLTPGSPSELLARVVLANFQLPDLPKDWLVPAAGPSEVLRSLMAAKGERRAYVLWEPYVSKALAAGARVLLDSGRLQGYIVDVLVAERRFLRDHPDVVQTAVAAYLRAAHAQARAPEGMAALVRADAKAVGGEALDETQARRLVDGIHWKNTLENYAYFGLQEGPRAAGAQVLEDVIANITSVLVETGALAADPLAGRAHELYYDRALLALKESGFHPGMGAQGAVGEGSPGGEAVRVDAELVELGEGQWRALVGVGELKVAPIAFARGRDQINIQSRRELARLAALLQRFPKYYLTVLGHARAEGDAQANLDLARRRAEAAAQALRDEGVAPSRIRAQAAGTPGRGGEAQAVSFQLGQRPY